MNLLKQYSTYRFVRMSDNQFEHKIDTLFQRKRIEAAKYKTTIEDPCEETKEQLKHLPFNVTTVLRQIQDETERRAKTLKRGVREDYNDFE